MGLDDHYQRGAVERELDRAAAANKRLQEHYAEQAALWAGAMKRLNQELATDMQRFAHAMKKHRKSTDGSLRGLHFILGSRPLGLPTPLNMRTTWYWRLTEAQIELKTRPQFCLAHMGTELVVTERAQLAALRGRQLLRDLPKEIFAPPTMKFTGMYSEEQILAQHLAQAPRRPPSPDEVNELLAGFLHQHHVIL